MGAALTRRRNLVCAADLRNAGFARRSPGLQATHYDAPPQGSALRELAHTWRKLDHASDQLIESAKLCTYENLLKNETFRRSEPFGQQEIQSG